MFKNINDLQNNAEKVRDLINNADDLNARVEELEEGEGGGSEGGVSVTDYLVTFDASTAQSAGESAPFSYVVAKVCDELVGASKFDIFPTIPSMADLATITYSPMNRVLCKNYGVNAVYVNTGNTGSGDSAPGIIIIALDSVPEEETILALTVRVYE